MAGLLSTHPNDGSSVCWKGWLSLLHESLVSCSLLVIQRLYPFSSHHACHPHLKEMDVHMGMVLGSLVNFFFYFFNEVKFI